MLQDHLTERSSVSLFVRCVDIFETLTNSSTIEIEIQSIEMSVLPYGFLAKQDFPYISPIGLIVGDTQQQQLGTVLWSFDTSGNSFALNSNFQLNPANWYTINYEFTIEATAGIPLPSAITIFFKDVLGLIPDPPQITLPINEYTTGTVGVFQAKYSGTVWLDANFDIQAQDRFQFVATLVPNPAQVGTTNLTMNLTKLSIQGIPYEYINPYSYTITTP